MTPVVTPESIEAAAARIIRQNAALNKTIVPDQFVRDSAASLAGLVSGLLTDPNLDPNFKRGLAKGIRHSKQR